MSVDLCAECLLMEPLKEGPPGIHIFTFNPEYPHIARNAQEKWGEVHQPHQTGASDG